MRRSVRMTESRSARAGARRLRLVVLLTMLAGGAGPGLALDQPLVWRDPDTGCAYYLTPQGGVSPRFRRDGLPDCPDVGTGTRIVDDAVRGLSQGLSALQREIERLRERFGERP